LWASVAANLASLPPLPALLSISTGIHPCNHFGLYYHAKGRTKILRLDGLGILLGPGFAPGSGFALGSGSELGFGLRFGFVD
jgi:hypothetical protein